MIFNWKQFKGPVYLEAVNDAITELNTSIKRSMLTAVFGTTCLALFPPPRCAHEPNSELNRTEPLAKSNKILRHSHSCTLWPFFFFFLCVWFLRSLWMTMRARSLSLSFDSQAIDVFRSVQFSWLGFEWLTSCHLQCFFMAFMAIKSMPQPKPKLKLKLKSLLPASCCWPKGKSNSNSNSNESG